MIDLTSSHVVAPIIEPANYGSAGVDADSINTGLLHRIAAALLFGNLTGNSTLTAYAGASAGAKTTALPFQYRIAGADGGNANADQLGAAADVAATGLLLTAATFDHRLIAIDIDPVSLPDGKPWLTLSIDNVATTLNVAAWALGDPRYASASMQTVL